MSVVYVDNRQVHYEAVGRRGMPIIFLHSWIGSWRYWLPTMEHVSEKYRALAFDFWGYGDTSRASGIAPTVGSFTDQLLGFMDTMGIVRASVVGHGLGGMVAVKAAANHPDRFVKVMTVNTPFVGASLTNVARPGTLSRLMGRGAPHQVWTKHIRALTVDFDSILGDIVEDTEHIAEPVLNSVLESMLATDLRPELALIEVPLLAVYGERDALVGADQVKLLHDDHQVLQQALMLPKAHHFPFLNHANVFNRALMDYQESQGSPVELKTEWRRRVSQLEYI